MPTISVIIIKITIYTSKGNAMSFTKTQEQLDIIEFAKSGNDLIIQAYAGSSKTFTLKSIAEELPEKKILYIAFNKSIVEEATKKMPSNVTVKTIHAVAYGNSDSTLLNRLKSTTKLDIPTINTLCGVKNIMMFNKLTQENEKVSSYRVCSWVMKAVVNFMHSDKPTLLPTHVYLDKDYEHFELTDANRNMIHKSAITLWDAYCNNTKYHIVHDVYLKLFSLSGIDLKYDVILVDECQDVSGVMLNFLTSQKTAQKIYVGDKFQKIYSFTGSVDITKKLPSSIKKLNLTKTFRFGQEIAKYANQWIDTLDDKAPDLIAGRICPVNVDDLISTKAILCRTNAGVLEEYLQQLNENPSLDYNISCDTTAINAFMLALKDIDMGKGTNHPFLSPFTSITDMQSWVDNNWFIVDRDILKNVNLAKKFGYNKLLSLLLNYVPHGTPDVVISTVHKAKGLEWDEVKLSTDFTFKNDEELRLFYVAVTRAIYKLVDYKMYDITNRTLAQMRVDIGDVEPPKIKPTAIPSKKFTPSTYSNKKSYYKK